MAPRKAPKRKQTVDDEGDPDYRKKRDKNNEAVKKSRSKTKQKAKETTERIEKLKSENSTLEDKVKNKAMELKILRDLLVSRHLNKPGESNADIEDIERLLQEDDD